MALKLTVTRKDFSDGINTVIKAISGKANLPILNNILMETEQGGIRLVATDLQLGTSCFVACVVQTEGTIAFPAKSISEYLANTPENAELTISVNKINQTVVKFGGSEQKFLSLKGEDYPRLPEIEDYVELSMPQRTLKQMADSVLFAVSDKPEKPAITGMLIHSTNDGIDFVGTDSHRVAVNSLPSEGAEASKTIIPQFAMAEVLRLLSDTLDPVQVLVAKGFAKFNIGGTSCVEVSTVTLQSEGFPAWHKIMPSEEDIKNVCIIQTEQLLMALRRLQISARENGNRVNCTFADSTLTLNVESHTVGEGVEVLNCEYTGTDGFSIAFNLKYILDFLRVAGHSHISFSTYNPLRPALLLPVAEDSGLKYVSMPMNTK